MHIYSPGFNVPRGGRTLIKAVNGDTLSFTVTLRMPYCPTPLSGDPDSLPAVTVVLSENRFTSRLWTGSLESGAITLDENRPGLAVVRIPRAVMSSLRRGVYTFSILVDDGTACETQHTGNIQVEYEPTSVLNDIPYRSDSAEGVIDYAVAPGKVAIGNNVRYSRVGVLSTTVGPATEIGDTEAVAERSVAIGADARVGDGAAGAVQLGQGTNTTPRSLQFLGANLVVASDAGVSLGADFPVATSEAPGAVQVGDGLVVRDGVVSTAIGSDVVDVRMSSDDKRVALGEGADASGASAVTSPEHPMRAVAVGFDAKATGPVATAVGEETRATADSSAAFGSKAESAALGAIQLGNGVNTTERSLQFRGANLFKVETATTPVAVLGTGFPKASKTVFGAMKVGDNLSVVDGVVSAVVPTGDDIKVSADDVKTVADSLATKADEFAAWEQTYGPAGYTDVRRNGNGWGVWYSDAGHFITTVIKGDENSTSLSWTEDETEGGWPLSYTRRRVLRTGDADKLTGPQTEVLDGGPYLRLHGGGTIVSGNGELNGTASLELKSLGAALHVVGGDTVDFSVGIAGQPAALSVADGRIGSHVKAFGKDVATADQVTAVSDKVDELKSTVSVDSRFLVGGSYSAPPDAGSPTTAAIQTRESETAEWTDEIRIDKGYDAVKLEDDATETVSLDKSVQTVRTHAANLVISIPQSVDGTVRDFCVYIFNQNAQGGTATAITASSDISVFQDENDSEKWNTACPAGGQIAVYLTAIPDASGKVFHAVRSVLKRAEDIA